MAAPQAASIWPTVQEYDQALQNRIKTIYDADIKRGVLAQDAAGPMRLNGGGGKYVCVYKVSNWAVRCFTGHPPSDMPERYEVITAYLKQHGKELPFLVSHTWLKEGVRIRDRKWPLIKVPYISGCQPIGEFLATHYDKRGTMLSLADKWLDMVGRLERLHLAHGDLDVTNVLVSGTPPEVSLHLIDFDGMYVPTFDGRSFQVADLGHEHFQPVKQGLRQFNHEMDRFSALVIYLSLVALAENSSFWYSCDADESCRLLLGADDFQRPAYSRNVVLLHQQRSSARLQRCLQELLLSMQQSRMPKSLAEILAGVQSDEQSKVPSESGKVVRPATILPPPMPVAGEVVVSQKIQATVPPTFAPTQPVVSSTPSSPASPARRGRGRRIFLIVLLVVVIALIVLFIILKASNIISVPAHVLLLTLMVGPRGEGSSQDFYKGDQDG
jgi:hypothetical protein